MNAFKYPKSSGRAQALCGGTQRQHKGQWAQTATQEVPPEHEMFFPVRVAEPWNRLPRELVESPLQMFKSCLDACLCNLP